MYKTPGDFTLFHMCTINKDHMMYGSWDIRHDGQFFIILGHFLPIYPPNNPKNKTLKKKMKKPPEIIIILHLCTTNDNHIMYGSWNMERDR